MQGRVVLLLLLLFSGLVNAAEKTGGNRRRPQLGENRQRVTDPDAAIRSLLDAAGDLLLLPDQIKILQEQDQRMDAYTILNNGEPIATGGEGQVFFVQHKTTGYEIVAKKGLYTTPEKHESEYNDREFEKTMMQVLNGKPFMAHYLGGVSQPSQRDGERYHPPTSIIFMNKAAAGNVFSFAQKLPGFSFPIDSKATRQLMAEMVVALAVFHMQSGYIHRDIKPHNFLIGGDGHVRLTDFGLAIRNEAEGIWEEIKRGGIGGGVMFGRAGEELPIINVGGQYVTYSFLDNRAYRAPETLGVIHLREFRSAVVSTVFRAPWIKFKKQRAKDYANKLTRKVKKLKGKYPTTHDVAAMKQKMMPKMLAELQRIDEVLQASEMVQDWIYGRPSDYFALGMSFYDMVTDSGAQKHGDGPFEIFSSRMNGATPYFDKPADFANLRRIVDALPKKPKEENIAQLVDLLSKMLEREPEKRLANPFSILAHPYFASVGITLESVLTAGLQSARWDNEELAGLTVARDGDPGELPPNRPLVDVKTADKLLLEELLHDAGQELIEDVEGSGKDVGPGGIFLGEIEKAPDPEIAEMRKTWKDLPKDLLLILDENLKKSMQELGGFTLMDSHSGGSDSASGSEDSGSSGTGEGKVAPKPKTKPGLGPNQRTGKYSKKPPVNKSDGQDGQDQ